MAGAINKIKTNLNKSQFVFLLSWLIAQFFLLFFGDRLKIDPVRSFNGLYYLPLSYFSAVFIFSLVNQQKIFNKYLALIVCAFTFFLTTLPNYCLSYKDLLFAFTDFKSFQLLSFPSKKQVEAFSFLEKNTGVASGVMAMYEASSLIMGFSGNAAELGMDHQTKTRFYANQMSDKEAYRLLKTNHFYYVYFGYQEKSVGGNLEKYPFLKKIFQNEEATVYGVLYTTPL